MIEFFYAAVLVHHTYYTSLAYTIAYSVVSTGFVKGIGVGGYMYRNR